MAIGWPVPLLKKIMSIQDIREAMAYQKIEPWGEWKDDYRAGMLASTYANVHIGSRKKMFKPSDFIPDWSGNRKKPTLVDQIKEVFSFGNDSKPSH